MNRGDRTEPVEPPPLTWRQALVYIIAVPAALGLLLFLPAGRLDWTRGWLFLIVCLAALIVASLVIWRVNPVLFGARSRFQPGTKDWDRVLATLVIVGMLAIFPVAALDNGRFQWSNAPGWMVAIGYVLFLGGVALMTWAQAFNRFFEPGVRIQTERGHHVIDTGPYALVRHPGYVGAILIFAGAALALGSLWALVPAAIASAILILRTAWEDETLVAELPGFAEYARRVTSRLIPGVW